MTLYSSALARFYCNGAWVVCIITLTVRRQFVTLTYGTDLQPTAHTSRRYRISGCVQDWRADHLWLNSNAMLPVGDITFYSSTAFNGQAVWTTGTQVHCGWETSCCHDRGDYRGAGVGPTHVVNSRISIVQGKLIASRVLWQRLAILSCARYGGVRNARHQFVGQH